MSKRKSFPLRVNEDLLKAVQQWAADDLRSVNAQLEFIIREALFKSGRIKKAKPKTQIIDDEN
ncbi:Arc family DNA-binding protein [Marinicella sp. W31]|uniref:Arc family DNA-binding protein n=1 Tax=Marinicella sp. W31 TaxID=3023713 RepID=UPI003756D2AC